MQAPAENIRCLTCSCPREALQLVLRLHQLPLPGLKLSVCFRHALARFRRRGCVEKGFLRSLMSDVLASKHGFLFLVWL